MAPWLFRTTGVDQELPGRVPVTAHMVAGGGVYSDRHPSFGTGT